jgi:hypothetical protein
VPTSAGFFGSKNVFVLFAGAVYRVFVGYVLGCLSRCFLLGCRLGSLCILRGALCLSCVLRGALRFLIYTTLLIKKKVTIYQDKLKLIEVNDFGTIGAPFHTFDLKL